MTESVALLPDIKGTRYMPLSYIRSEPSLLPIERPRCAKCQSGRMMLARSPLGFDIRTFECTACHTIHLIVVSLVDPMKSTETGRWFAGLQAPT